MCPHARRHPAQNWPHGPIVDRCRDCGAERFDGTPGELFGLPLDGGPEFQRALDLIEKAERG